MSAVRPPPPAPRLDGADEIFRQLAETVPLMVWSAAADGTLDFVNARVLQYTGLSRQSHYGWSWKAVVHRDDWDNTLATWTRSLQSGERYEMEYRLRRADGAFRWHHASALPQRGADGRVLHWFGTCVDIEDQVRSAQLLERMVDERGRALRESELRFQQFMDHLPAQAWIRGADCRYTWVNQAFAAARGRKAADIVGEDAYAFFPPEDARGYRERDEAVRASGGPMEFVDREGDTVWLKVKFPVTDERGGTGVAGIALDITDRVRLENALRESEQRFQAFMDNLPAPAWIRGADLRYVWVNQAFSRTWGVSANAVVGEPAFRRYPPGEAQRLRDVDDQVRAAGGPLQFVDNVHGENWLKVKFPLADRPDKSGKAAIGGIAFDITARVQAEEKVQRYAEDARRLMHRLVNAQESERRRLADDLHDLIGQNLTALGIELAALRRLLPPENRAAVAGRLEAMAGLVNDTVESIRGVMAELRPAALEEFGLVPALRAHVEAFAERTGLKVSISVPGEIPRLPREAELALFRIAQEALTNAAKHSGGTSVDVAVTAAAGRVRLSVHDDGRGFADPVGARGAGRGGYGLPEMRERAEAHGGSLRIEFPGRGARLVAELPGGHGR